MIENPIEIAKVHLKKIELREDSTYLIKYSGCVIARQLDEFEQEHRYVNKVGPIDFIIPGKETGAVEIKKINQTRNAYNKTFFVPCSESEMKSVCGKLLIRIRNILFIDAMIFIRHNDKIFRLEKNHGPVYLYLNNNEFFSLWNELMGKEN